MNNCVQKKMKNSMLTIAFGLLIVFVSLPEIESKVGSGCYYNNYCWKYCGHPLDIGKGQTMGNGHWS